jgi:hypothetical protein
VSSSKFGIPSSPEAMLIWACVIGFVAVGDPTTGKSESFVLIFGTIIGAMYLGISVEFVGGKRITPGALVPIKISKYTR